MSHIHLATPYPTSLCCTGLWYNTVTFAMPHYIVCFASAHTKFTQATFNCAMSHHTSLRHTLLCYATLYFVTPHPADCLPSRIKLLCGKSGEPVCLECRFSLQCGKFWWPCLFKVQDIIYSVAYSYDPVCLKCRIWLQCCIFLWHCLFNMQDCSVAYSGDPVCLKYRISFIVWHILVTSSV